MDNLNLRYPIGKLEEQPFSKKQEYNNKLRLIYIQDIQDCPSNLEKAVANLNEEQLNTPYRDGGWTVKQVVHHVSDSHMNAFIRFKLALTETCPVIKPYDQNAWAQLPDTTLPVTIALAFITALHEKWVKIINSMSDEDWKKTIYHPEHQKKMALWDLIGTYAWHGKHHATQIIKLRERNKW